MHRACTPGLRRRTATDLRAADASGVGLVLVGLVRVGLVLVDRGLAVLLRTASGHLLVSGRAGHEERG